MTNINYDLVEIYYKSFCENPPSSRQLNNRLYYLKSNNMKIEWLALKCAHAMFVINSGEGDENG